MVFIIIIYYFIFVLQVSEKREKWTTPTFCFFLVPVFKEIGWHLVQLPWDWVKRGSTSISTKLAEALGNFVHIDRPFVVKERKWRIIDGVIKPVSLATYVFIHKYNFYENININFFLLRFRITVSICEVLRVWGREKKEKGETDILHCLCVKWHWCKYFLCI